MHRLDNEHVFKSFIIRPYVPNKSLGGHAFGVAEQWQYVCRKKKIFDDHFCVFTHAIPISDSKTKFIMVKFCGTPVTTSEGLPCMMIVVFIVVFTTSPVAE